MSKEKYLNYQIRNVITGMWSLERAHGPYKLMFPQSLIKRLSCIMDFYDRNILHLFSGISKFGSVRVDINPACKPDLLLDLTRDKLPFKDNNFDLVIADPPYRDFKPYCFVKEAVRVLKPRGFLIILHFLIYKNPSSCRRWALLAVSSGPNMRMRSLNIFRKLEE